MGKGIEQEASSRSRIPEDEITGFCLWLKNDLSDSISKVSISKRLKDTPALLSG